MHFKYIVKNSYIKARNSGKQCRMHFYIYLKLSILFMYYSFSWSCVNIVSHRFSIFYSQKFVWVVNRCWMFQTWSTAQSRCFSSSKTSCGFFHLTVPNMLGRGVSRVSFGFKDTFFHESVVLSSKIQVNLKIKVYWATTGSAWFLGSKTLFFSRFVVLSSEIQVNLKIKLFSATTGSAWKITLI